MSTIVVVRKHDSIVIASDTVSKVGNIRVRSTYRTFHDKISRYDDTYVGTVGAAVHQDVLDDIYARYKELFSFEDRNAIFRTYLKLHPILKEEYFINSSADKDDEYESSQIEALVANSHGIFGMYSWRTVIEYERFWGIGSGREFAMGAMHALYETHTAEEIARAGVLAACDFDDASELPVTLYSLAAKRRSANAG